MYRRRSPSLETIVRQFRLRPGLYVLGAGASVGDVPFGQTLMWGPALEYVHGGSFPASLPEQSPLNRRIIAAAAGMTSADVFLGQEVRRGTDDFPVQELIRRLPNYFGRMHLQHLISRANFEGRISDSYGVFGQFHPGLVANYNHDGLASRICSGLHEVIEMHGSVRRGIGSPELAQFLERARDYDFAAPADDLLMCVPESFQDLALQRKLLRLARFRSDFVAFIGYSFGFNGTGVDDAVSLDFFTRALRYYPGNIFVIEPRPERLSEMLAERLKTNRVFGIVAYWNVLAHAIVQRSVNGERSLNYASLSFLDRVGGGLSFPDRRTHEPHRKL